jgi:transposase
MSRKGTSMRKVKETLRLHFTADLSLRQIAESCGIAPATAGNIIKRAISSGITWPLADISNEELRCRLFGPKTSTTTGRSMPGMKYLSDELKKKSVTLKLLWEEYRLSEPDGYSYSQFCDIFKRWRDCNLPPSMRMIHKAGEKMFTDWAGQTIEYFEHGESCKAYLFVSALGASNYTFAQVYPDMKQQNFLSGHIESFEYFEGVPEITVPDNPRTAVTKTCLYDPELNPAYQELASHYDTVVLPARSRHPRDKAKVENAVQYAERWILAALRKMQFLSFGELKTAVRAKLEELNNRSFQKMEGSRKEIFERMERAALKPLPFHRFSSGEWKKVKVHIDYHVQLDNHYYSVHHRHIGKEVEARLTGSTVEIFLDGTRLALHKRSYEKGKATTLEEHMPEAHHMTINVNREYLISKAEKIGPFTAECAGVMMDSMPRPEMAFRSCQGVIRMASKYGRERLERACHRALQLRDCRYRSISSMLKNNLEELDLPVNQVKVSNHYNLRGRNYYTQRSATC